METRIIPKIKVSKNKKDKSLFKAIKQDDLMLLLDLLSKQADITILKGKLNCVQYAAKKGQWEYVITLIKHSINEDIRSNDYMRRLGEVLLLAAENNQQEVVETLFKLVEEIRSWDLHDHILFPKKNKTSSSDIWKNENNGYNALHWAVEKDNAAICDLFTIFGDCEDVDENLYDADSTIYRAKNKKGQTAFELAVSLERFDCAKNIAKGMSLHFFINNINHDVQIKSLLNDISFPTAYGTVYRNLIGLIVVDMSIHFYVKPEIAIKERVIKHILNLDDEEKRKGLEMIIDNRTALNELMHIRSAPDKYIEIAENALNQMKVEIEGSEDITCQLRSV